MAGRKSTKRKNPGHIGWQKPTASQKKWGVDLVGYTNDNYCYEIESETVRGTEYHEVYIMPPAGSFGGGVREKVGTRGTLALAKALAESNYERMVGNRANPRARRNPLAVNPKHWAIYNSTSGAELGTYPGSSASAAWKNLMKDVGGRYQAPGPDIVIKPVHKLRARKNPLTVNPRHVGATKPPGTVVIEDNVHKVPGYIVVTHAQVALAQRHAPGIAPLASLVTTDKGGPGRKAKRWHRWFLPESIKAQPWATASIKRRNPAKRRKNPMGDTWAITYAGQRVNPRKSYGTLCDYHTGNRIRKASAKELSASKAAAKMDGGAGVILCSGRACYVEGR